MAKRENLCFACAEPIKGTLKKFHDDKCKDAYYSERRKLNRAASRAIKALEELSAIRNGTARNNRILATKHLLDMQQSIQWRVGSQWQCANCDHRLTSDTMPTKCPKCSQHGFINVQPQI